MTREELIKAAERFDKVYNEGGDGYNPYRAKLADLENNEKITFSGEAAIIDRIDALTRKANTAAKLYDTEEEKRCRAEIEKLQKELDDMFAAEWTEEVTKARRQEWNNFVKTQLTGPNGKLIDKYWEKINEWRDTHGWDNKDLKRALELHNIK